MSARDDDAAVLRAHRAITGVGHRHCACGFTATGRSWVDGFADHLAGELAAARDARAAEYDAAWAGRWEAPASDTDGLILADHPILGWALPDPTDGPVLVAALDRLVADWRVPNRYRGVIPNVLNQCAKELEVALHPEMRERVTPPRPPETPVEAPRG